MSPPRSARAAAALLTLAVAAAACHRSPPASEPAPRDPAPRQVAIGDGTVQIQRMFGTSCGRP